MAAVSGPGVFHVDVAQEQVPRAMVFLNALVMAAEQRGHGLGQGDDVLAFVVDGQAVDFKLLELIDRTPHSPTEEEKLAVEKWETMLRMFAGVKTLVAEVARPEIPEFDFVLSGRLQVVVAEVVPRGCRLRRLCRDNKTQRIEMVINAILECFAVWAAVKKAGHYRR